MAETIRTDMPNEPQGKKRSPARLTFRRTLRWIGAAAVGVFVLVVLIVSVTLLPPVRVRILSAALNRAGAALPGDVRVSAVAWPSLGSIDVSGLAWTDAADSLLTVDHAGVSVRIMSLFKKDVRVQRVVADGLVVNVPGIQARLAAKEKPPRSAGHDRKRAFPRRGSLPGVPSICVENVRVNARSIRWSAAGEIRGVMLSGGLDAAHGDMPWIRVDTLSVRGPGDTWRIDDLALRVDPTNGVFEGSGHGALSPRWPLRFEITPVAKDRFTLAVSPENAAALRDSVGLAGDVALARDGLALRSVSFHLRVCTPGTKELSLEPSLASRLEGLPELEGVTLEAEGQLSIEPETALRVSCGIEKNDWIEGGRLNFSYAKGVRRVEPLFVAMPGLTIDASASLDPDSLDAAARILVTDMRWLRTFRPGIEMPDTVSADISVRVKRRAADRWLAADIDAAGRAGGFTWDDLRLRSILSLDSEKPSTVRLAAHTMDWNVGLSAEVDTREPVVLRLSPIIVRTRSIDVSSLPAPGADRGEARFFRETHALAVANLRVVGDEGEVGVDGHFDGRNDATYRVGGRWPDPPAALVRALGLTKERADSLAAHWDKDAPFTFDIDGDLSMEKGTRAHLRGRFRLPGPRNLATLLPDSARVADMGPVEGGLSLVLSRDSAGTTADLLLDLSPTAWIDSSRVHAGFVRDEVVVDTIGVLVEGVRVGAAGRIRRDAIDVTARLRVERPDLLRRFYRGIPEIQAEGNASCRGPLSSPSLHASLAGSIRGGSYSVPRFAATLDYDSTGFAARADAASGVITPQVKLDRALVSAKSTGRGGRFFPMECTIAAAGKGLSVFQSARVDTTGGVVLDVDTLTVVVAGKDLRAVRPFRVQLQRSPESLRIDDLDLRGSQGKIEASGTLAPDSSNFTSSIDIVLPETPPAALPRERLWPERVIASIRASGVHDVAVTARVDGFSLVDKRRPSLDVKIHAESERVRAELSIADSAGAVALADVSLPAAARLYPPSLAFSDSSLDASLSFHGFPIAVTMPGRAGQEEIIRVNGTIGLGGTAVSPSANADLRVNFADWPKLSRYAVKIGATYGPAPDSRAQSGSHPAAPGAGGTGVTGRIDVTRDGASVLTAQLEYPLVLSLDPPTARAAAGGELRLNVDSEGVAAGDLDPLLPADVGLGGEVRIHLQGSGPHENAVLDGSIVTDNFEVVVANEARVLGKANIAIAGSTARPGVKGNIEIKSALISVPDRPKGLHPFDGGALLLPDTLAQSGPSDTTHAQTAGGATASSRRRAPLKADIDLNINIPSGFWIRGKGLDIELSGVLSVKQKDGKPVITGELRAIRGTFVVLGRSFTLGRGTVTFYGNDETNPSLDVSLSTTVQDTKIEILIGGTVQKPTVTMESDPEMPEADIVSTLLFGQPYGSLDEGQEDLVKKRSTEMLVSLGAAKFQEELGEQLGVDVVTVSSAGPGDDRTTLNIGKYLNPRVLLSYAYAMGSDADSYVHLEYFLRGRFKLESAFGLGGRTALGVGWSKDY